MGDWGISDLRSRPMAPQAAKEDAIVTAVETYEADYKSFLELGGDPLDSRYRAQALGNMLTGEIRRHIMIFHSEKVMTRQKKPFFVLL